MVQFSLSMDIDQSCDKSVQEKLILNLRKLRTYSQVQQKNNTKPILPMQFAKAVKIRVLESALQIGTSQHC